jgi:hypothetical protein
MWLPLGAAVAAERADERAAVPCGWGLAGILLLLTLAATAVPARGEDDAYSATVKVDATAADVAQARDQARRDGQRQALIEVLARLSGGTDTGKLGKLDDKAIGDMVASFEVANERMSAVRYLADYTFHFRPGQVRRLLGNADVAVAEGAGKPVVVLPVYIVGNRAALWEEPNRWRRMWALRAPGVDLPRLIVPSGDAGDAAAIDAAKARAGDTDALNAIAGRSGAEDVVVALATAKVEDGGLVAVTVETKRYHLGQLVDTQSNTVEANPDEAKDDFMRRVAEATAADIESGWKKTGIARYDQQGSLTAVVAIAGLEDWVRVRDRLSALAAIRKVELMSLSRQEATIEIQYIGNIDQLKAALAGISFDLVRGDPAWRLARGSATPPN